MTPPRGVIIAAAASHSGKTTISVGLIAALKARGLKVAAAKCGPDYIDPKFLEAASGGPAINLDPWAMRPDVLAARLARHAAGADFVVIEGVMGLFDGGAGGIGSTASLAQAIGYPAVLVVGAQGVAQTTAAIAEGAARLATGFMVAGAIVNQVASDRHAALIHEGFARTSVPLLGMVRRDPEVALPSRHLGLIQAEEHADLAAKTARAKVLVEEGCDVGRIVEVAKVGDSFSHREKVAAKRSDEGSGASSISHRIPSPIAFGDTLSPRERGDAAAGRLAPLGQRIAVAKDVAFAFAYPHLLQDWRDAGAELLFFSPLRDEGPSDDADAVFLPGGYPELHAGTIAGAAMFRAGMERAVKRGVLIYGECGGYMVLGEELIDGEGSAHRMLGFLPVSTSFAQRKLHLGYRWLRPLGPQPWARPLSAHEFHFASIAEEDEGDRLFQAEAADGSAIGNIGLQRGRVMGSFAHVIDCG